MTSIIQWIIKTLLADYLKRAATLDFLNGYKTYIVSVGVIIGAVAGYVQGTVTPDQCVTAVLAGILSLLHRKGTDTSIKKAMKTPPDIMSQP